jgi:hypothetical protein
MNKLLFALIPFAVACGSHRADVAVATSTEAPSWSAERASKHPYFPLRPGATWTYLGASEGHRVREQAHVLPATAMVGGAPCIGLAQERHHDDQWHETTVLWFSASRDGSLWLFGEQTESASAQDPAAGQDSWLAGRDGAEPVLWLPGTPVPGQRLTLPLPHGEEVVEILAIDGQTRVPAGSFSGCLVVAETPDDPDDADIILYAPGVGRVAERERGGRLLLVERR